MSLLLALLALAAYFALPLEWRQAVAKPGSHWLGWCSQLPKSLSAGIRLSLTLLIPMVVLAVCLQALKELGLSLLIFVPSALVLLVIFGDIAQPSAAAKHLENWKQRPWATPIPDAEQNDWVTPDLALSAELSEARKDMLRESLQQLFSPLFWFLLATPVAALGYYFLRLAEREAEANNQELVSHWLTLADWIPTRLLALSFALAGNFTATWAVIRERLLKPDAPGHELIDEAAEAAEPIDLDAHVEPSVALSEAMTGLQALLQRALIVWMVMLALHTLWPGA